VGPAGRETPKRRWRPGLSSGAVTSPNRPAAASTVRLGLLGCGTVGSALIQLVDEQRDAIEARTGLTLTVSRVAGRNAAKDRGVGLRASAFTTDPSQVVTADDVDIVVEVMGGIEPARRLVLDAVKSGKPIVTANKELLANVGAEVFNAAAAAG